MNYAYLQMKIILSSAGDYEIIFTPASNKRFK